MMNGPPLSNLKGRLAGAAGTALVAAALLAGPASAAPQRAAGAVFVQTDDPAGNSVVAYDRAPDGSLYAALIDGKEKEDSGRPSAPVLPATPSAPVGEVTVTESFSLAGPQSPSTPAPSPRPLEPIRSGSAKGAVVRVSPTGEVDLLWTSSDEMPHALAATEQ